MSTAVLVLTCSACAQFSKGISDVVLENTWLVQDKWGNLTPYSSSEESYTFVKFELSSNENLAVVWEGLMLQTECEPGGGGVDKDLFSTTFGPFYDGQQIPYGRLSDDFGRNWSTNADGRYIYVVFALPNMNLTRLVDGQFVDVPIGATNFEYISCYFRGVTMLPLRIPKSAKWTITKEQLIQLEIESK